MTEIIFCKTDWFYESYQDFWRLVELAGFPIISVSDLDISKEGIYITAPMNEDWRIHINNQHQQRKPVNAHLILWNIERPSGSAGSVLEYAKQCKYLQYGKWDTGEYTKKNHATGEIMQSYGRFIDEIWTSDRKLSQETGTSFVVLGSNEGLGSPGTDKQYNFCHISYMIPRRTNIYNHFSNIGPNCWGTERDAVLKASKFALNIHQDNHPFQEPLRLALFAAYGLPILTETILDSYPWSDEFMAYADYHDIVGRLNQMLIADYEHYRQMGLRARARMCTDFEFGKMVRQAVKESTEAWR